MRSAQTIIEQLRERGERITLPRRAVIAALCALSGHHTAQDVQHHLAGRGIVLAEPTIYRVLQWLKDVGLVAQTDLGHSGIIYELLSDPPHHHLVCLGCGAIMDVEDSTVAPLRTTLRQQYGFEPRIDHLAIFGLCQACQSAPPGPPTA